MKPLKTIVLIAFIPLFTFCTNQKSKKSRERVYTNVELIGKWNQVGTNKSQNNSDTEIEYIQLVNDSVAELQICNSNGEQKISGTWKNQSDMEIAFLGMDMDADIKLTYSLNDHHLNIFLLNIEEKDEQLMMTVGENEFVKE
jgi:hypothetical protein